MAIQPVDLQLAYLAAPASAAAASVVQEAPAAAQAAAQAAFVNQLEQRQETVEETQRAEGSMRVTDKESGNAGTYTPGKRRRYVLSETAEEGDAPATDGETHFIDTMA